MSVYPLPINFLMTESMSLKLGMCMMTPVFPSNGVRHKSLRLVYMLLGNDPLKA
jgi:hypothetical protein